MIHYFYGEDTYAARQVIGELGREDGATLRWADGADFADTPAAAVVAQSGAGLFGRQILVVRDVSALPIGVQQDLAAALAAAGAAGSCVLWDRPSAARAALIKLPDGVERRQFARLGPDELVQWLQAQAQQRGGEIAASAAREMVERLGYDRWRLKSELDKLLLGARRIDVSVVKTRVPEGAAVGIFPVLEALAGGDGRRAVQGLSDRLAAGDSEFYLLSMLAYQFRTMYYVRRGIAAGSSAADIARSSGIADFAVRKNFPYARRFSLRALREALTRILAVDFAVRSGRVEARTGLVMLVLGLAARSRA